MVINIMCSKYKILKILIFINVSFLLTITFVSSEESFNEWVIKYKSYASEKGVSQQTIEDVFKNIKFVDQVIKYDRRQPEFFEDTLTYVSKRANTLRKNKAKKLLIEHKDLFNEVERNFSVEKEILTSLWAIETNFGKHVGKMDILSCLATLSFDKRRSEFFSSQLLTLLLLIDNKLVDKDSLYGSWAGAFGNFQFMPSTIKNYALDYDGNGKIELKTSLKDSLASAANYINQIGWKKNKQCFYRVKLNKNIKKKYINISARNIKNRMKISYWKKKGIVNFDGSELKDADKAALISPDNNANSPSYLVFQNYEKILQWNRSLRFGISVCTLANMIKT